MSQLTAIYGDGVEDGETVCVGRGGQTKQSGKGVNLPAIFRAGSQAVFSEDNLHLSPAGSCRPSQASRSSLPLLRCYIPAQQENVAHSVLPSESDMRLKKTVSDIEQLKGEDRF
ncbi:hypothetical protein DPEC_G00042880 [Dallia pectoralis]|uniref:Uncharacterized protein n=1 Tax=Dallia pectoralis TaxID=75939 RepID=A0ACC2H8X3_DALPE|nr:hypothetical protein DPEC_G00042880 [Dallia pectoralis]